MCNNIWCRQNRQINRKSEKVRACICEREREREREIRREKAKGWKMGRACDREERERKGEQVAGRNLTMRVFTIIKKYKFMKDVT